MLKKLSVIIALLSLLNSALAQDSLQLARTQVALTQKLDSILAVNRQLREMNQQYAEIVSKTNEHLDMVSNPYGWMVGLLGVLFTLVLAAAAINFFNQKARYEDELKKLADKHTENFTAIAQRADGAIVAARAKAEEVSNKRAEELSNKTDLLVGQLVENANQRIEEINQRLEYFQKAADALTSQLETQLSQLEASRKEASQMDEQKRREIEKVLAELKNARKSFDKVAVTTTHPPTTAAFGQPLTTAPVIPKTVVDTTPLTTTIPWGVENPLLGIVDGNTPLSNKSAFEFDAYKLNSSPYGASILSLASNGYGTTNMTCEKCGTIFTVQNDSPLMAVGNPSPLFKKVAVCPNPSCKHENKL